MSNARSEALTARELWIYRFLGSLAAVAIMALGIFHRMADGAAADPLPERLALILACAGIVALSFVRRGRSFVYAVYFVCYLLTLWVVHLVLINGLTVSYGLSLIIVIASVSVVFRSWRALTTYLLVTLGLVIPAVLLAQPAQIDRAIYMTDVLVISLVAFVTLSTRLRMQEDLADSEARYKLAAQGSNEGLWDWDLGRDQVYYSERWKALLGHEAGDIGDAPAEWLERVHPDDQEHLQQSMQPHLDGQTPHFVCEYRMRHRDGGFRWMLTRGVAVRDAAGRATRLAGSQADITERRRAEEQLVHDAFHDPLTELPNRALFMDRLERLMSYSKRRSDYQYAVIFLDLDRFKLVNDSLGHLVGDAMLVEVSRRLRTCVREADTVARLSGDEFAILLDDLDDPSDATRVAERVHEELGRPFAVAEHETYASASIGIAMGGDGYERADDLLRDADTAMYRAKEKGRGLFEIFDHEMHARATALLRLEGDLRRALDRGEFLLHFQPIVDLGNGQLAGFEALIRWAHPERGLVQPLDFIPVTEETGLIIPLGAWVLEEACRTLALWLGEFPSHAGLFVSVNLSARQFSQPNLVEVVQSALRSSGLSPDNLRLEITESVVMADAEHARSVLSRLQKAGIHLSIDDFGTGYSSLSYLHRFHVDTLKIDRSFIGRLSGDRPESELVRTVLTLARSLGLKAVAEGIETEGQREGLMRIGCEFGQGFLFSRPLAPDAARDLLARNMAWTGPGRPSQQPG